MRRGGKTSGSGADEVMVSGHLVFAPLRSVLNMRHWRIAPLAVGGLNGQMPLLCAAPGP